MHTLDILILQNSSLSAVMLEWIKLHRRTHWGAMILKRYKRTTTKTHSKDWNKSLCHRSSDLALVGNRELWIIAYSETTVTQYDWFFPAHTKPTPGTVTQWSDTDDATCTVYWKSTGPLNMSACAYVCLGGFSCLKQYSVWLILHINYIFSI